MILDRIAGIEREISRVDREILKLSVKREELVREKDLVLSEGLIDCHKPLYEFAVMN